MSIGSTVRTTIAAVWPAINTSLQIHTAQRTAVKANPGAHSPSAIKRAERPWRRVVAEETVWALAKQGFLCSEEQAAVVEAAREWAATAPVDYEMDHQERALYTAVQALTASLEGIDEAIVEPVLTRAP